MWIFDSYFKGCVEPWSRERGLERISAGGGLKMNRWTCESDDFLKSFQKDLAQKKVAIFISSAVKSLLERQGKTEDVQKIKKSHLEDEALKYHLHPIALGLLGGVWDKNKMGFLFRRTLGFLMKQFEAAGFKEISPGLIDTRDLEKIRKWTRELVQKGLQ